MFGRQASDVRDYSRVERTTTIIKQGGKENSKFGSHKKIAVDFVQIQSPTWASSVSIELIFLYMNLLLLFVQADIVLFLDL